MKKAIRIMKHIVSFSGGKDSTAMLLRMIELGMPIDEIIYFDCESWEFPQMQRHIIRVQEYIKREITRLKPKGSLNWWFLKYKAKRTKYPNHTGKGFPRMHLRWCTGLKRDVIRKYQNSQGPFIDYIGFAYDEQHRIKPHKHRGKNEKYPLIDWKWTEQNCLDYCYSKGFDWEGLYKYFSRVSCWCCPLQGLEELRNLRRHFPELWQRLLKMQEKSWSTFRPDGRTVFDLEERFKEEDRQMELSLA